MWQVFQLPAALSGYQQIRRRHFIRALSWMPLSSRADRLDPAAPRALDWGAAISDRRHPDKLLTRSWAPQGHAVPLQTRASVATVSTMAYYQHYLPVQRGERTGSGPVYKGRKADSVSSGSNTFRTGN